MTAMIGHSSRWLRKNRYGLFSLALIVGLGAGVGALLFRGLVYGITWLVTGHVEFGQDGRVPSDHLPWLGLGFYVVIPVIGGLIYGPMVYRWAREARGHGVPEVMVAVAEGGGRIRPRVAIVKALASALTIGTGGSVGREGPIVQMGAALASTIGQGTRQPAGRLRILVACGAAGGIAATFNAPITGVFFGAEIILREISAGSLFSIMLAAMVADAVVRPILCTDAFLTGFPHN
ncbi:MAG: chloride channel protein, partial [Microbacterium sp.]|nr:chloride channel protein [Microbacterium sp.]